MAGFLHEHSKFCMLTSFIAFWTFSLLSSLSLPICPSHPLPPLLIALFLLEDSENCYYFCLDLCFRPEPTDVSWQCFNPPYLHCNDASVIIAFGFCNRISGKRKGQWIMPTAMVSSNKDHFFSHKREILDVGYPWYHICPSFLQSSVSPLYHVIFILTDSRELLYLHAFLILRMKGKWEERRSVEHVCYTYTV